MPAKERGERQGWGLGEAWLAVSYGRWAPHAAGMAGMGVGPTPQHANGVRLASSVGSSDTWKGIEMRGHSDKFLLRTGSQGNCVSPEPSLCKLRGAGLAPALGIGDHFSGRRASALTEVHHVGCYSGGPSAQLGIRRPEFLSCEPQLSPAP